MKKDTPTSTSSRGTTTKAKVASSFFIKDSSGRCLTGRYRWGKKGVFKAYLDSLTSAEKFISEKGIIALRSMGPRRRFRVMQRLHLIDPEGFKTIQGIRVKMGRKRAIEKRKKLDLIQAAAINENKVALAQASFDMEGVTKFRFVPADGILATVAYLLAVGHSRMEVAEKLKLDPDLIRQVTPEMVAQQRKAIGMETIIRAANQKVAFDLTSGNVTKETAIADSIATKRMKLIIDARNTGKRQGLLPSEIKDKAQGQADRFGVTVDVAPTAGEDE